MTLNDLEWPFCVKVCHGLVGTRYLTGSCSRFQDKQSYVYTVSGKNVAQGL